MENILSVIASNFYTTLNTEYVVILSLECVAIFLVVIAALLIWESSLQVLAAKSARVVQLLKTLNKDTVTVSASFLLPSSSFFLLLLPFLHSSFLSCFLLLVLSFLCSFFFIFSPPFVYSAFCGFLWLFCGSVAAFCGS
jgi:hypothetical protein